MITKQKKQDTHNRDLALSLPSSLSIFNVAKLSFLPVQCLNKFEILEVLKAHS